MSDGADWADRPEGFIRFRRLDGNGEDGTDLRRCRRYIVETPSYEEPSADVRILYMTPEGRWVEFHGCREANEGQWCEGYREVDPVEAAHRIWVNDHPKHRLPPELEPFREYADFKGYSEWLARDSARSEGDDAEGRTRATRCPVVLFSGPDGYRCGPDERLSLSEILELGWELHKWLDERMPLRLYEWDESETMRGHRTEYPVPNPRFYPWDKLFLRAERRLSNYRGNILASNWTVDSLDEEMLQGWLLNVVDSIQEDVDAQEFISGNRQPHGIPIENLDGLRDALRALESHLLNGGRDSASESDLPPLDQDDSRSASPGEMSRVARRDDPSQMEPSPAPCSVRADDPDVPKPPKRIEVYRLNGQVVTADLNTASRWSSFPNGSIEAETRWTSDLYRTPGGRWFIHTNYKLPSV